MNKMAMGLKDLFKLRPMPVNVVCTKLCQMAKSQNNQDLDDVAWMADRGGFQDEYVAHPALVVLPAWNRLGIKKLMDIIVGGYNSGMALSILLSLANNESPSNDSKLWLPPNWRDICNYSISDDLPELARLHLRELMLEQITDSNLRSRIFAEFFLELTMLSPKDEARARFEQIISLLMDSRLLINPTIMSNFEGLLNSCPDREEELHKFLIDNPVMLDPLAIEVHSKHELGDDYITDFIIRRINNEYIVVEIENSTDKLFTKKGSFSSNLIEATSQVRDFQAWISDNLSYAQSKLPGIRHPAGLVVIGRSIDLDDQQLRKLKEENFSKRGHTTILTYDDILEQAKIIYSNMLHAPMTFKGKRKQ